MHRQMDSVYIKLNFIFENRETFLDGESDLRICVKQTRYFSFNTIKQAM